MHRLLLLLVLATAVGADHHAPFDDDRAPDATLPMPVPRRLLVVAPHPDDIMLSCGLAQRTLASGGAVRVVDVTCGDGKSPAVQRYIRTIGFSAHPDPWVNYGYLRQREDRAALDGIGLPADGVVWLGYPDGGMWEILRRGERGDPRPVAGAATGATAVPYANAPSPGAPYVMESVVADLAREIARFRPDTLVLCHPNDNHPDHASVWWLGQRALARSGVDPASVAVRVPLDAYGATFPLKLVPGFALRAPGRLPSRTRWFALDLTARELAAKVRLIGGYPSQMAWEHPTQSIPTGTRSYMYGYAATNELFGEVLAPRHDERYRRLIGARELARRAAAVVANVVVDTFGRCGYTSSRGLEVGADGERP